MKKLKRLASSLLAFGTLVSSCATATKPSQKERGKSTAPTFPEVRTAPPESREEPTEQRVVPTGCGDLLVPTITVTPPPEDHTGKNTTHLSETREDARDTAAPPKKRARSSPKTKKGEPEATRKLPEITAKAFTPDKSKLMFSYTQLCSKDELKEGLIPNIVKKLRPDKKENIQIILPIFVGYLCKFPSKDSYQFIQGMIETLKKYYGPSSEFFGFLDEFSRVLSEHAEQICRPGGCDLIRDMTFRTPINKIAHKFEGNIDVIKSFLEVVKIEDILDRMRNLIDMDISVLPHGFQEYQWTLRYIKLMYNEMDSLIDHMCKDDPKLLPLLPIYKTKLLDIGMLLELKLDYDGKVKES